MKINRRNRKLVWALSFIVIVIIAVIIFFQIPYSPISSEFQRDVQRHTEESRVQTGVFTEQDIAYLPEPFQDHLRATGIIGQPIMSGFSMIVPSTPLYQTSDGAPLVLDYNLYVFAQAPIRLAYMQTSMFGIPFEAYDSFQRGNGFMRGVIGKVFTLFNETGIEMDRGLLLTYLAESPMLPSLIFSDYITWEAIDANNMQATITHNGISGGGIFTFGDDGFIRHFRTSERARIGTDGSVEFLDWSIVYENWIKNEDGIYLPSYFQVIWHEAQGDFVYFESINGFVVKFR